MKRVNVSIQQDYEPAFVKKFLIEKVYGKDFFKAVVKKGLITKEQLDECFDAIINDGHGTLVLGENALNRLRDMNTKFLKSGKTVAVSIRDVGDANGNEDGKPTSVSVRPDLIRIRGAGLHIHYWNWDIGQYLPEDRHDNVPVIKALDSWQGNHLYWWLHVRPVIKDHLASVYVDMDDEFIDERDDADEQEEMFEEG